MAIKRKQEWPCWYHKTYPKGTIFEGEMKGIM